MKIRVLCIAKTSDAYILEGMREFEKRLQHFCKLEWMELPEVKNRKNLSKEKLLAMEEELFMKQLKANETVYLLDEKGKLQDSRAFSNWLDNQMSYDSRDICFVIG